MPVEMLTYAVLGARLKISPEAARSLAKQLRLPRSLSHDGKTLVSVDLAEIRHTRPATRYSPDRHHTNSRQGRDIAGGDHELEARAAGHRADFERERERADRLMSELLQATAETMAAKEATARLEGELAALRIGGRAIGDQQQGARRLGHLAATIVEATARLVGNNTCPLIPSLLKQA